MSILTTTKMAILVTGGAGFIGSEFVRQAVKSDRYKRIYVVDKLTYAADLNRIRKEIETNQVTLIKSDINDTSNYKSALMECSGLFHFAAETHVDRSISDGSLFIESNISGTYKLLELARSIRKLRTLIVSTDEVYGSCEIGETTESSSLKPSSIYSASKASADLIALANMHTHHQDIIITRACNNFGQFQFPEKLIPLVIERLLNGENVPVYGNGLNIREWIHISDHVSAIDKVFREGRSGRIYNIGSGERFTNLQVVQIILESLDLPKSRIEFVEDRLGHDYRYALNSDRIRSELAWKSIINFRDGIVDTIKWHKEEFERKKRRKL